MTHDELLNQLSIPIILKAGIQETDIVNIGLLIKERQAVRAVVELHKPIMDEDGQLVCSSCLVGQDDKLVDYYFLYPCYTIKAIMEQLE